MNIVKIWENEDGDKKILVKNKETYYLLKEEYITCGIRNWFIFYDYNNDKDFLINEDTEECDLQDVGCGYATLFDCLKEIKERKEEW